MRTAKRFLLVLLVMVMLFSSTGALAAPEQASCRAWHTVRRGQTLSSIAAYYGVHWPYLAQVNNVHPPRYVIFTGQVLCIPSGTWTGGTGGYPVYNTGGRTWSFSITGVTQNANVTIQTHNFPNNVLFQVRMGRYSGGAYNWENLGDLDTGSGGSFSTTFTMPAAFSGANQLVLRLTQVKKNGRSFHQDQVFWNVAGGGTGGIPPYYPPHYFYGIPTIWIVSVQRDTSVTIQTHNFPPGLTFDVLMNVRGTRGVGGYHVGTLNSGAGGVLVATFPIPAPLRGLNQVAIRTQHLPTGYHSFNWFWNNTTY